MQIHNFHPQTGEYLGSRAARLDPLETAAHGEDVYLIPAHATTAAPPALQADQAAVWDGSAWSVVDDYRGAVYYSTEGQAIVISELGVAVPAGMPTTPRPNPLATWDGAQWVVDLAVARKACYAQLSAEHNAYMETARRYGPAWMQTAERLRREYDACLADAQASGTAQDAAQAALDRLKALDDWLVLLGDYFNGKSMEIFAAADLAALQAVTWDYGQFDAGDPNVTFNGDLWPAVKAIRGLA